MSKLKGKEATKAFWRWAVRMLWQEDLKKRNKERDENCGMIFARCSGDARVFVSLLAERGLELVRPLLVESFEAMRSVASSLPVY